MKIYSVGKILIILIVSLVVFNSSISLEPIQKAHAIPVVCANCSQVWSDVIQWVKEAYQWSKEYIYPALRDAAIKRIMDQITDDTVNWIENGGEPRFVSDWNGFLEDNFSAAVGDVILQTRAAPICSPFKAQVSFMLLPKRTLRQRARCTIEDIGLNLQNFYDDFISGGWLGYSESWAPQNNYFMTAMMVYDEALIAGQKAQTAKAKEAEAGKGFLSVKRKICEEWDEAFIYQCQLEGSSKAECQGQSNACLKYKEEIITPGDAVGEAFRDTVTSDSQWARSAQSALSLIVDALINRVVKEGIDYVKDAGQRDQQRQADQQDQDIIERTNYQQTIYQFLKSISSFRKEWDYLRITKQQSYDAINGPNGLLPTLNEMQTRNCQPPYSATVAEISSAQALSIKLDAEITDLKNKIAQADKISQDLNNAVDGTNRERIIAQQNSLNFDNQYNIPEMQEQIRDGSARNVADAELADLLGTTPMPQLPRTGGKLSDARTRLQLCIQAQSQQNSLLP